MKYQDIRTAFELCSVSILSNGITLGFPCYNPPDVISVSINDENNSLMVFRKLLETSNRVDISLLPNRYAGFSFCFELPSDGSLVFQPLKTPQQRSDEIQRIINEEREKRNFTYEGAFDQIKKFDSYDMVNGLLSLAEERKRLEIPSIPEIIDGFSKWERFIKPVEGFLKSCGFGLITIEEPTNDIPFGSAEIHVESNSSRAFQICNIDKFLEAVDISGSVSIDSYTDSDDSMITLTFFS